jgi:hypothetical protein
MLIRRVSATDPSRRAAGGYASQGVLTLREAHAYIYCAETQSSTYNLSRCVSVYMWTPQRGGNDVFYSPGTGQAKQYWASWLADRYMHVLLLYIYIRPCAEIHRELLAPPPTPRRNHGGGYGRKKLPARIIRFYLLQKLYGKFPARFSFVTLRFASASTICRNFLAKDNKARVYVNLFNLGYYIVYNCLLQVIRTVAS